VGASTPAAFDACPTTAIPVPVPNETVVVPDALTVKLIFAKIPVPLLG
jgi:hypothetical protein